MSTALPMILAVLALLRTTAAAAVAGADLTAVAVSNNAQHRCAMRGICGRRGGLSQNCPYDGPPRLLDSDSDTNLIRQLCPHLLQDGNSLFCCDGTQLAHLAAQMTLPRQLLSRCPSCFSNFVKLWCDFTCSPRQSEFIRIVSTADDKYSIDNSTYYIIEVEYYVSERFANGLLSSCKDVRAVGGDYALSLVCGVSASECTVKQWFKFMGEYNEKIGVPFTIDFIVGQNRTADGRIMHPPTTKATSCSASPQPGMSICSCQDCPVVCKSDPPFPLMLQEKCRIASMDCMLILSLLAFAGLCFAIIFFSAVHYGLKKGPEANLGDFKPTAGTIEDADLGAIESFGCWIESQLELACAHYGELCYRRPLFVLSFGLITASICSSGMFYVKFTTEPVKLWSAPGSRALTEKNFFDANFGPFYRTEQIIVYPRDQSFWSHPNQSNIIEDGYYGPALRKEFLKHMMDLQQRVTSLVADDDDGSRIALSDVCFKPMKPDNKNCAVLSVLNYFQNDASLLEHTTMDDWSGTDLDYLDHIISCTSNPFNVETSLGLSCLSAFGVPIQPYTVLGDFNTTNQYDSARGIIITILLNNFVDASDNSYAITWEKTFVKHLKNISHPNYTVSFISERSIQDEIERESQSDAFTILISYMFMFAYVAFALGQYQVTGNNLCSLLIHSKVMLGIAGVLIVALSVTSSIGLYAFYGIPATMIILEVQPFLVLAVGVDNIFIFVQSYQRMESTATSEHLRVRVARICGEVVPSMLLSSLSECLCFFLGSLSSMPAVKVFSLYAALAIFFDFFLQITCFLSLFILDMRRQENGRPEVCCCRRLSTEPAKNDGYMLHLFSNYYAPFILSNIMRVLVLFSFVAWLCSSMAVINRIQLGFDQKMAVPEDSYVLSHFNAMDRFLSVGPPVYFVVKGDVDYTDTEEQNLICSGAGCARDSLGAQVARAAKWSNRSFIAHPTMNWLDDYIDWLRPHGDPPCCRRFTNGSFCPARVMSSNCSSCDVVFRDGRPRSDLFYDNLDFFLKDNPDANCAKGGHAAYAKAIKRSRKGRIVASHFMTYHTVLKSSMDFINAMDSARRIAANISAAINREREGRCSVEVFPYSVFYVFYEQYATIISDACVQLMLSLVAIFAVTTVLLGLDPWSAFITDLTIGCVLFNLIGLMYWWSIDFNAISVVNLVMSVGISVEFCSHIVRTFAVSVRRNRLERARHSLAVMGSSVLSGITLTKFGGILVLAFAHSQIFKVYYFRMFFGIVFIGAAHGLIFLPVLLSFIGPPVNKHKMLLKVRSENCCMVDCGRFSPCSTKGFPVTQDSCK